MTVRRFTGRCGWFARAGLLLIGVNAGAAPVLSGEVLDALIAAEGVWVETLIEESRSLLPYDEQIFTEISPIQDAPDAIRLPPDQVLKD